MHTQKRCLLMGQSPSYRATWSHPQYGVVKKTGGGEGARRVLIEQPILYDESEEKIGREKARQGDSDSFVPGHGSPASCKDHTVSHDVSQQTVSWV